MRGEKRLGHWQARSLSHKGRHVRFSLFRRQEDYIPSEQRVLVFYEMLWVARNPTTHRALRMKEFWWKLRSIIWYTLHVQCQLGGTSSINWTLEISVCDSRAFQSVWRCEEDWIGTFSRKELPLKGGGRPSENPFWYFFVPFHNFLPVWCEDLLVGAFPLASFFVGNALPKMQRLWPERSEVLWTELLLPCERWTYPRLVWWFEVLFVNAGVSGNRAVPHIICSEWWEWRTRNSSYGAILAENCEHLQVSLVEMILKHSQLDGLKQPYLFGMFRCTTADSFEQTSSLCWIHGQSNHWLRCEKKSKDWLRWCERKWSNTLLWHVARVSVVFSLLRHKFRSGNFSMLCMALTGVLWDSCLVFFDNSCLSAGLLKPHIAKDEERECVDTR